MTEKSVEMTSGETVMKAKKPAESLVHPSEADIRYSESPNRSSEENITIRMLTDGKALQIFLNDYSVDYNSVKDVMETALKFSLDPAKLVLDAMEGFYPPHLKKGGVEFEEAVVRKNCIMLLEWLTKMSPYIEPAVKMEAKKLAFDWKRKMKSDAEHSLEVLAFVQLLAAFEIACKFRGELEKLLGIIAHYRQAPSLLRDLYFAEEMAKAIEKKLRVKEHRAEAAELISAFELDSEFPDIIVPKNTHKESSLAPLLGNNGAAPTISVPMSSSNTVLSTPESQTLLAGCSNPISINSDSEQEEENDREDSEEENDREDSEEENEDEFPPWIVSFVPECLKHDDTRIESLVLKIRSNQLRCIEISDALRLASDPAEFVLGVLNDPSSLNLKSGLRSVCLESTEHGSLLLLNYLWRMSPHVKPD
ncbi:FRIGIDA-like protein 3 [Linum perenne]